MPTIADNRLWSEYDWRDRGDEWSQPWGTSAHMWYGTILPRILPGVPCDHILEIAPGHGRCTQFLRFCCRRLSVVDLVEECIRACRERFGEGTGIEYHVNDGRTLSMIPDASVDFVFSWDSLVHVEADVMESYVGEIARTLRPGGAGILHHSNLGAFVGARGPDTWAGEHARARSMTAAKFVAFCRAAGLRCLSQELLPWGGARMIDCLSYVSRPAPHHRHEWSPVVPTTHPGFAAEVDNLHRISEIYDAPEQNAKYFAIPPARSTALMGQEGGGPEHRDAGGFDQPNVSGVDLLDDRSPGPAGDGRAGRPAMRREGFHTREREGRWTNGRGVIAFAGPVPGKTLSLEMAACNPRGSRLRVMIDGALSSEVGVAPDWHSEEILLPGRVSRIELESDTFVPEQIGLGTDGRTLGIFVARMILR